jgi:hypothetical protein
VEAFREYQAARLAECLDAAEEPRSPIDGRLRSAPTVALEAKLRDALRDLAAHAGQRALGDVLRPVPDHAHGHDHAHVAAAGKGDTTTPTDDGEGAGALSQEE